MITQIRQLWKLKADRKYILNYRFDRRQGVTDLAKTLMNGKEANWNEDDPLPFTAAHLLQLPDLIRNTISPQSSNEKGKEEWLTDIYSWNQLKGIDAMGNKLSSTSHLSPKYAIIYILFILYW